MHRHHTFRLKKRMPALQVCLATFLIMLSSTFLGLSTASATAMTDADVQAQFTVTQPTGIEVLFLDPFPVMDIVENARASAMAQASASTDVGNDIQLRSSVSATASPTGFASGIAAAFGSLELTNNTSDPIDVDFTLVYEWTIQGSVTDPSLEQAHSGIALDVFINDDAFGSILKDGITPPNFNLGSENSAQRSSITQVFSDYSIPSGTTFVDVALAAQAEARSAAVPEPSTLLLFGSGIVGLALYNRTRRR